MEYLFQAVQTQTTTAYSRIIPTLAGSQSLKNNLFYGLNFIGKKNRPKVGSKFKQEVITTPSKEFVVKETSEICTFEAVDVRKGRIF